MRPALLLVVAAVGCGAPPPARPIATSGLETDVDTLQALETALHPGLTRYRTADELDRLFRATRARVSASSDLGNAFLELTALTAALRCGHSYPNFSNQSKEVAAQLFHANRLPFLFRWIDGAMVVTEELGGRASLGAGTTVVSIGGVGTAAILDALLPLARADGANDAKRRAYLEDRGQDGPVEAFDVLASLRFPALFASAAAELAVIRPDGTRATVRIPLMTFDEHARAIEAAHPAPAPDAPLWTSRRIDRDGKRIVYLAMPTWVAYKSKWDWRGDLDRLAQTLVAERVDRLIVDLRGNEGGNDVGDVLLAHVIAAPLAPRKLARRVRFGSVPAELRPYLDTWDRSFFELGKEAREVGGGWRELPEDEDATIAAKPPRFTGKLVVLIDAANSSATFQFARTVQDEKLGVLVGTPTGGSLRGINGGAFFFARLPKSGLEVDIPLIGTFPTTAAPDRGIAPDVPVATTAAAIAQHRDPVLEAALAVP